ncbi:MAG TPA: chemoreceptor glutamine deamidase CheD [Gammaproteobacteria bacterium]
MGHRAERQAASTAAEEGLRIHKLLPGQFHVAVADELIMTLLGSCVAACIFDPVRGIGGMNHFLLPDPGAGEQAAAPASVSNRYGVFAMESLINSLLTRGASRSRLLVKLFGGARILPQLSDVGRRNIDFVRRFVATEGLSIVAEDLGGEHPRKILMQPASGRVRVKKLPALAPQSIGAREKRYLEQIDTPRGSVELF